MPNLPDISKLFPCEKIYEDLLQPSIKELGSAGNNVVKTARFLLAPFDYLAGQQDRFQAYLKRISEKVEPENLTFSSPQIVGECLEGLRYLEPGSLLTEMFLNLLASSADKTRISLAHPAYPLILRNLCRDEGVIIYLLNKSMHKLTQYSKLDRTKQLFGPRTTEMNTFPVDKLDYPNNFFLYMDHLHSLNLAGIWQDGNQEPIMQAGVQLGVKIKSNIVLQEFGVRFAMACAVENAELFGI